MFKDTHLGDLGMEFAWDRTAVISILKRLPKAVDNMSTKAIPNA